MSTFRWMTILVTLAAGTVLACGAEPNGVDLDALRAPPEGSVFFAGFDGRVPCGQVGEGCERIKVSLTLHRDASSQAPTTFVLEWIYVGRDNIRHVAQGTWSETNGTPWDPAATVYEISDGGAESYGAFLVVREEVLLFLDAGLDLRVGDAGHSYALSRTR